MTTAELRIGRVVLRGSASAIERARATLPAALARAHWPDDEAIVVVRRLTVGGTATELPARAAAVAEHLAPRAADPWSPAADAAEAVRFRDALDYRACLVHDLLAGSAARRWLWRHRAALLARPTAQALTELLAEDALALPALLDRPALRASLPALWRTLDAAAARAILAAIGRATGWQGVITSALDPTTHERRAEKRSAFRRNSIPEAGEPPPPTFHTAAHLANSAFGSSALRSELPAGLPPSDPRVVLRAVLALWANAPATLAAAGEALRATAEMLARPAPDTIHPTTKQMMAAGQGIGSLPFKGVEQGFRGAPLRACGTAERSEDSRAGVGMGQADVAETHPPPNQESRLRLAASQAASSARRNPCFAPLEGGGTMRPSQCLPSACGVEQHAGNTSVSSPPNPTSHRVSSVAASAAALPSAADVDFHTRGGGFFFLLNVLNLPALRDWRATLSSPQPGTVRAEPVEAHPTALRQACPEQSRRAQGERGNSIASLIVEPQAGWRELVRLARWLGFTPDAPLAAFLATACALETPDDAATALTALPPGADPAPVHHAAQRYYGDAALAAALAERPAHVRATASHLDVHLRLADVQLDIRRTGLDLDPGWLPWLGRVVRFHYDSGDFAR